MRAVVLDATGQPQLADVAEPKGRGELVHVLACGLCGSDVEKLGAARGGTVLGHEVVAEADGRRVALVHHRPCGRCERCQAGHESTCGRFGQPTIVPGGFAERALARGGWVELPDAVDDALGSFAEPLACVLRGAELVPRGRVLVVGCGFVGTLFVQVLRRRGDEVFVHDLDSRRAAALGQPPQGPVDAAVLCARGGGYTALAALEPGGTLLVFAAADGLDPAVVYRKELTVSGSRSATPRHLAEAVALLPELDPIPTEILPLERFTEGLERYRRRVAVKVVFTP